MEKVQVLEKSERGLARDHRLDTNHETLLDYAYGPFGMVSKIPMRRFWKVLLLANQITRDRCWEPS